MSPATVATEAASLFEVESVTGDTAGSPHHPIRILHIIVDLKAGGAELMLKRLISGHLHNPGFEHRVISLRSLGSVGPELQAVGIEVEAFELHSPFAVLSTYARLSRRVAALRPDIVQTWMYHADLIGGLAARSAGIDHVIWGVRIADISTRLGVSPITGWVRRLCAKLSDRVPERIVYVAESARNTHEALGYSKRKSIVVPNGYLVPTATLPDRTRAPLRVLLGVDGEDLLVGSAGRFNRQKNHRSFVEACSLLAGRFPKARFIMFGRGVDNANEELASWIRQSGFADRFHLLGERKDLLSCLAGLDIFCLHSLGEGFPNVVAEAMSVGTPCVVTDVGDAAALVEGTGRVVPPSDDRALAEAMAGLLELSPAERLELGQRARQRIENQYSMDAILRRYEELYAEVARTPADPRKAI